MKPQIFILLTILTLTACKDIKQSPEYQQLRADLITAEEAVATAKQKIKRLKARRDKLLVHLVYFKLKPELAAAQKDSLIDEIKALKAIEVIKELEVGAFQNLGDERAMSDYEIVMQMGFASEADYRSYQAHPLHQQLKANVGQYLGGPPVTYDYWTK